MSRVFWAQGRTQSPGGRTVGSPEAPRRTMPSAESACLGRSQGSLPVFRGLPALASSSTMLQLAASTNSVSLRQCCQYTLTTAEFRLLYYNCTKNPEGLSAASNIKMHL